MEISNIKKMEQIGCERFVLITYLLFGIMASIVTWLSSWPLWLVVIFAAGWGISLTLHLIRYGEYHLRAMVTTALLMSFVMLWSMHVSNLYMVMPVFAAIVVLLGIYGIPEIIFIPVAVSTFLFFYHGLIIQTLDISSDSAVTQLILMLLSVYAVEFIMYFLTRKRIEAGMRQQEAITELLEAERSKDDFLANVSHEIRTPINTICGMSEIVLREQLEESVRADVFSIQTAGRNLLSVVSDVLDFSELQSGKLDLVEEAYNITSTINDVINMSMARKNERQIELIIDCAADIPSGLVGDEQKIRRVIMNLVNNALKFTMEGCVSIVISHRPTEYGVNLIVKVKDTGIGMAEESLERLFTTFNQVDTKRNRQEGGIGLGLAISRAIVEAMGGFITVRSELGRGSEFQFVIPQKIINPDPIARVKNPERLNVAVYVDMEQFDRVEIRDQYGRMIFHLIQQLGVQNRVCRNLAELKRRAGREIFTHIIISILEYEEGKNYFDELSRETKVIVILDRIDDYRLANPNIQRLYKPLFVLPIVLILNNEKIVQGMDENYYHHGKFIAPNAHILVVDDNLMNIRVLEGLVRPYEIKVSMATSGMEALEKIENMDYDFVFMDHMMPEMDGIETMHRIRQKPGSYFKKVPIIALTANAIGGMREVFLAEGFQDFVAKPVELSVLERVLRRHIPQNKQIRVEDALPDSNLAYQPADQGAAESQKAAFDQGVMPDQGRSAGQGPANGQGVSTDQSAMPRQAASAGHSAVPGQAVSAGQSVMPGQAASTGQSAMPGQAASTGQSAMPGQGASAGQSAVPGQAASADQETGAEREELAARLGLPADRFDVCMGVNYCGDMDNYIEVVRMYYSDGAENQEKVQSYYNARNWKNYAILVHALKSGMKSIGVMRLSEMARELESASKREDEKFIWANHEAMMREYEQVLQDIGKSPLICPAEEAVDVSGLEELEEAEFASLAADMEDAAYSFDGENMTRVLERLKKCSYRGHGLARSLEQMERKVEMSDYISAAEAVMKLKTKLDKESEAEGGAV